MLKRKALILLCGLILLTACGCSEKEPKVPDTSKTAPTASGENIEPSVPKLKVIYAQKVYEAARGTYNWTTVGKDGKAVTVNADSLHPTQLKEFMPEISLSATTASHLDLKNAYLKFDTKPKSVSIRAWAISDWKNFDDAYTNIKNKKAENGSEAQFLIELAETPHIYEITAVFKNEDQSGGEVSYCFYTGKKPALENAENINAYCGNTMTTVYFDDDKKFTFMGENSVELTDILRNLEYNPDTFCKCLPEYTADTEFGLGYGINITEKYVRTKDGQAKLTKKQADEIKKIIEWARPQAE